MRERGDMLCDIDVFEEGFESCFARNMKSPYVCWDFRGEICLEETSRFTNKGGAQGIRTTLPHELRYHAGHKKWNGVCVGHRVGFDEDEWSNSGNSHYRGEGFPELGEKRVLLFICW